MQRAPYPRSHMTCEFALLRVQHLITTPAEVDAKSKMDNKNLDIPDSASYMCSMPLWTTVFDPINDEARVAAHCRTDTRLGRPIERTACSSPQTDPR